VEETPGSIAQAIEYGLKVATSLIVVPAMRDARALVADNRRVDFLNASE